MAGSPCPLPLMRQVVEVLGATEMTIGYGQTEASPIITQTSAGDPIEVRVGTVGRPIPGVKNWKLGAIACRIRCRMV